MAKTKVKSYLQERKKSIFAPFIIELEQGEYLEIPSSNSLSNNFKTEFGRLNLRFQEVEKNKNRKDYNEKQMSVLEDLFNLVNDNLPVFKNIDAQYGSVLWWIVFRDWSDFCKEQLQLDDLGK